MVLLCSVWLGQAVGVGVGVLGSWDQDRCQVKGTESPPASSSEAPPWKWALGEGAPSPTCLILCGEPRKVREARLACSVPGPTLRPLPLLAAEPNLTVYRALGFFVLWGQPCGRGRTDAVVLCLGEETRAPCREVGGFREAAARCCPQESWRCDFCW